jgi:2',3'-cyclic-nucleotide 2'-phosphodiesterase (5'-nucleotidase family)
MNRTHRLSALLLPILLLVTAGVAAAETKKLTILYSNDLHAHLEPHRVPWVSETRLVGGFANFATLVKREKARNPNALYFDAGDFFTGPYISSLTKGEAVIDAMNHLGLDAACVGNHEFDHGWQNTRMQLAKAKFPILNGNIFIKGTEELHWNNPYVIIEKNGLRIGVIGLHGKFAFYDTTSDEMIQGIEARDEEIYLKKYIDELTPWTDLLVLLIHQGIPGRQSTSGAVDVARNLQKDIELARRVPGLDLIVTGHAHTGTPKPLVSNGTIIVSTDAYTIELGKLDLTYDVKKDRIVRFSNHYGPVFDDAVPDDPEMSAVIEKWKNKLRTITDEVVTRSSVELTRSYGEESVLGDLVADAMLDAYPDFDFAITNSGGLRQDIDSGPVTVGELISAFPFPNTVYQLEMKGSQLRKIFEHGAGLTNGILQASRGVEMEYDERLPVGRRVVSCRIKGEPLSDDRSYRLLTSNFLADGGDGFLEFKNASFRKNTGVEMLQAMIRYLKKFETYAPKIEGRVRRAK